MRRKIEPEIKPDEILIPCLLHPYWAKKGKMIRNALLPPHGHSDVSLLRLRYTNLDFCKRHAKSINIPDARYWGLGAILSKHINLLNKKKEEIGIAAKLVATPLNESFNII